MNQYPDISTHETARANEVATLMKTVSDNITTKIECNGTSSNFSTTTQYFKKLGYSANNIDKWDETALVNDIKERRMVIVRGTNPKNNGGHAWIADGYKSVKYIIGDRDVVYNASTGALISDTGEYYSLYNFLAQLAGLDALYYETVHYNWGYSGAGDGWYDFGWIKDPSQGKYTDKLKVIIGIQ